MKEIILYILKVYWERRESIRAQFPQNRCWTDMELSVSSCSNLGISLNSAPFTSKLSNFKTPASSFLKFSNDLPSSTGFHNRRFSSTTLSTTSHRRQSIWVCSIRHFIYTDSTFYFKTHTDMCIAASFN